MKTWTAEAAPALAPDPNSWLYAPLLLAGDNLLSEAAAEQQGKGRWVQAVTVLASFAQVKHRGRGPSSQARGALIDVRRARRIVPKQKWPHWRLKPLPGQALDAQGHGFKLTAQENEKAAGTCASAGRGKWASLDTGTLLAQANSLLRLGAAMLARLEGSR